MYSCCIPSCRPKSPAWDCLYEQQKNQKRALTVKRSILTSKKKKKKHKKKALCSPLQHSAFPWTCKSLLNHTSHNLPWPDDPDELQNEAVGPLSCSCCVIRLVAPVEKSGCCFSCQAPSSSQELFPFSASYRTSCGLSRELLVRTNSPFLGASAQRPVASRSFQIGHRVRGSSLSSPAPSTKDVLESLPQRGLHLSWLSLHPTLAITSHLLTSFAARTC